MEADIDKLTNEIARAERAQRLDADLARATNAPPSWLPGQTGGEAEPKTGRATASYKRTFLDAMRLNASPRRCATPCQRGSIPKAATSCPTSSITPSHSPWPTRTSCAGLPTLSRPPAGPRQAPATRHPPGLTAQGSHHKLTPPRFRSSQHRAGGA